MRRSNDQNRGTVDVWFGLDRSNIHEAQMKPPCCQSVIGLELIWHCRQLQKKPQVLPVAWPQRPLTVYLSSKLLQDYFSWTWG